MSRMAVKRMGSSARLSPHPQGEPYHRLTVSAILAFLGARAVSSYVFFSQDSLEVAELPCEVCIDVAFVA